MVPVNRSLALTPGSLVSELLAGHHGPPVSRDSPVCPEQDELAKPGHLLCPSAHAGLQPGPAGGHQHLGADPDPQVLDRDLAQEPGGIVKPDRGRQWKLFHRALSRRATEAGLRTGDRKYVRKLRTTNPDSLEFRETSSPPGKKVFFFKTKAKKFLPIFKKSRFLNVELESQKFFLTEVKEQAMVVF